MTAAVHHPRLDRRPLGEASDSGATVIGPAVTASGSLDQTCFCNEACRVFQNSGQLG